ncbi:hypothetical protein LMG27198_03070 [Methylocystis echinoides]|uniref:DUF2157 domain-containing protein n=2 Tax=Methylocystis echinoides TaxID=29468 RepID=A0A9W6GR05_9HYPH|nr:hypothetical protein LMG27198_03070 [Methylocystis echinoides]
MFMDDRKHVAWLYDQLPALIAEGALTDETAARLRARYGPLEEGAGRRRAIVLFGILGAALIGGGVILLLAHNWEALGRLVRGLLALALLFIAQGLSFWVLARRPASMAWREGAGTLQTMAIGASIALVSQTYHTGGAFEDFLLLWALLALPVAYLLRATLPAILYLCAIAYWASAQTFFARFLPFVPDAFAYWVLLALALPWWGLALRENRHGARSSLFGWALVLTLPVGYALSLQHSAEVLWPLWCCALVAVLYLAGERWQADAPSLRQRPLLIAGALGFGALGLFLSFGDAWRFQAFQALLRGERELFLAHPAEFAIGLLWVVAALALWADALRRGVANAALVGALPVVALAGYAIGDHAPGGAAALFNLYLLIVGVGVLVTGFRTQRLGLVNAGMAVLSALIFCRFFDSDLGFVARGVAFIVVGAGFLAANLVLLRKKGAAVR